MKPVFADTAYYLALLSDEDEWHDAAVRWTDDFLGRLIVTEYVLIELGNAVSRGQNRQKLLPFVTGHLIDAQTLFVPASVNLFRDGLELYAARLDKSWSLVDRISFNVMRAHRLTAALTTDHHFEQAGFRALLR